jgi:hypothetical protein
MQLSNLQRFGLIGAAVAAVAVVGYVVYKKTRKVVAVEPTVTTPTPSEQAVRCSTAASEEFAVNVEFICAGTTSITDAAGEHLNSSRCIAESPQACYELVSQLLQSSELVVHGDVDEIEAATSTLRNAALDIEERIVAGETPVRQVMHSCDNLTVMISIAKPV